MRNPIHEKAKACISNYKRAEKELLDILELIDKNKAYLEMGYSSLFKYATVFLGLSESEAYRFTQVTRKSYLVPELKEAVGAGLLTVSKASRIAPVITAKNQGEWIQRAISLPQRELEQAVAMENPKIVRREFMRVVTPEIFELRVSLSKEIERDLKRAQEVFRTSSLEGTIEAVLKFALKRKDPVLKSERKLVSTPQISSAKRPTLRQGVKLREPVPAAVRRLVFGRDKGCCQYKSCGEKRWTEIHHLRPLSQGGDNTLENLVTLCSSHHRYLHEVLGERVRA